jgi:hypothetical protein
MNPVLALEDTGEKTNQLPIVTVTSESDFKPSKASGIGAGGVSAQTTKPTKRMMTASRTPIMILFLRLNGSHRLYSA